MINKKEYELQGKYVCSSIRLKRYLYILGWQYNNIFDDGIEYYVFTASDELQEAINFFFRMRKNSSYEKNKY